MNQNTTFKWSGVGFSILAAMLLTACGKEEIKVYSVPKEKEPARQPAAAHGDTPSGEEAHPIHWTTPPGWKELAPTSMRVGNLLVTKGDKKAEVSIIQFPGKVGTELANVNLWRGQVGLSPVTEGEVSRQTVEIGRASGKLYEFSGSTNQTVAAVLEKGDTKWFFKILGDKEVVSEAKPAFVEFLKSISFHDEHAEHADQAKEPSVATKPVSTNVKEIPTAASGEAQWDVPAGWKETAPSAMVLKSFSAGDTGHEAKISVTRFPGDVGGPLANVNRWRKQLSLSEIGESELAKLMTPIDVLGGKATLVDMKSTDGKTRLMAATIPRKEQTWFYKIMGDEAAVAREKEAFVKFVQTVRYPNE